MENQKLVASQVETFKWLTFAHRTGLVFTLDGKPLKGMIVVSDDPNDDQQAVQHYLTSQIHQILKKDEVGNLVQTEGKNPSYICESYNYGAFDNVTAEQLIDAISNWRKV